MTLTNCPTSGTMVDAEIGRIATEYREANNLIGYTRGVLSQVEALAIELCGMPAKFDLVTGVGDQLTIAGKWLGWPRTHCKGRLRPVFGFTGEDCCETVYPVAGFCEAETWLDCEGPTHDAYTFEDDELYRKYLFVRVYQMLGLFDWDSLTICLGILWGEDAFIARSEDGEVVVTPGRALTTLEKSILPLSVAILPVAPTVAIKLHLEVGPIFGFEGGWGGFCEGNWLNPQTVPN